jgi:hypothetical protein
MHSESFGESDIMSSDHIKRIVVIGAGQSASDIIYDAVKHGKEVTWVIKADGSGPVFLVEGKGIGPYKNAFEAASTRILSSMSPSIYNGQNLWTNFWHGTRIGTSIIQRLIKSSDEGIRNLANYKGRASTKGFEKLEYDTPYFWGNGPGGILHHDDFWEQIANHVSIHRDQVQSVDAGMVRLESGTQVPCDAIVCGTGWIPSIEFFDKDMLIKLDLPYPLKDQPHDVAEKWTRHEQAADKIVCERFPLLANPPAHAHQKVESTPYRLYQAIAPINDSSILMMNQIGTGNKLLVAEMQAMWAVAYFDGHIKLPPKEDMEKDIALQIAFSRRRYLSKGEMGNGMSFESVTYCDRLLKEMGLAAHKGGWWKDTFHPFGPHNLGMAWAEYLRKYGPDHKASSSTEKT